MEYGYVMKNTSIGAEHTKKLRKALSKKNIEHKDLADITIFTAQNGLKWFTSEQNKGLTLQSMTPMTYKNVIEHTLTKEQDYIVALTFDHFDQDFEFENLDDVPPFSEMNQDALSESLIHAASTQDEAIDLAIALARQIHASAKADKDYKKKFLDNYNKHIIETLEKIKESTETDKTFDIEYEYGNWCIRIRMLKRKENGAYQEPIFW